MSYRYLSGFPLNFSFGSSLMPLSPWAPGLKSPVMSASHQIRDVNLRLVGSTNNACIVSPPPCLNALRRRIDGEHTCLHFFSGDPGPSNLGETRTHLFISLHVLHTFGIWSSTPDTVSPLSASPSHCGRPTFIDKPHIVVASHLSSYRSSSLIKRQLPHNDRNLAISHPADPSSPFPVPIYGPVDIETCKRNLLIITKIQLPGQF